MYFIFFFKQKTAYEMRISDWSSDVCSSDLLAANICEHIADGLALKEVCLIAGMPSRRTAYKWLGEHANFMLMYARAREERADLIADEIVTLDRKRVV